MKQQTNNEELLIELDKKFNEWKKAAGLNCSLEQLDNIFFIRDYILASGFVSPKISRMICSRIRDTFNSWIQQIHSWLMPSPYSIISTSENQIFDDKEKEELNNLLSEFMAFTSQNTVIGLTKDAKEEKDFVNNSIKLWKEHLPRLIYYTKKVQKYWSSSSNEG
ncbi:MAG: hypothetical protein NTZ02_00485 [Candidatus Woesearchaeota archaeon]|nr:hypothetical protein [Candidatus Woesearchaeota archaeon]